jgi:hypothetical protein
MIRGKSALQPEPDIYPGDVLGVQLLMLQLLVTDLRRLRGFDAAAWGTSSPSTRSVPPSSPLPSPNFRTAYAELTGTGKDEHP